jgi:hypothetical protein
LASNAIDFYLHKGDTAAAGDTPELNIATLDGAEGLTVHGGVTLQPPASVTPASNGQMTFELTSNTSLVIKVKGSDGTVRSTTLTLA